MRAKRPWLGPSASRLLKLPLLSLLQGLQTGRGFVISSPEELQKALRTSFRHPNHHAGWPGHDPVEVVRKEVKMRPNLKNSQVHKLALLRSQDQVVLRQWKLLVGVGGAGFRQGWEGTHAFLPTPKHLLKARLRVPVGRHKYCPPLSRPSASGASRGPHSLELIISLQETDWKKIAR